MNYPKYFTDPPDLPHALWTTLAQVPAGHVTTYGDLADALGNRIASRWIGHQLLHHEHDDRCICHRVVRSTGELGGHISGDPHRKARRLRQEGVAVDQNRVSLSQHRFALTPLQRPLAELRRLQERMLQRLSLEPLRGPIRSVGGVDLSYRGSQGVAAYALVDVPSQALIWSTVRQAEVRFPYITSYLAFREMPLLLELLAQVQSEHRLADVLLVDGSGIIHPCRGGIATMLGIVTDLPSIGVTKKLLAGSVDSRGLAPGQTRPVIWQQQCVGAALRPHSGTARPLYVSPGHRTSVAQATQLVQQLLGRRRLPEPIYWADRLSRQAARAP